MVTCIITVQMQMQNERTPIDWQEWFKAASHGLIVTRFHKGERTDLSSIKI